MRSRAIYGAMLFLLAIVLTLMACASGPSYTGSDLLYAANIGSLSGVQAALSDGVSINYADRNRGYTALMVASAKGHMSIVRHLVQRGASTSLRDRDGDTALDSAILNNQAAVVEYLMSQTGNRELYEAARGGKLDRVKLALQYGVDVNYRGSGNNTALVVATVNANFPIVEYLVENGANVNARNDEGRSALNYALEKGEMEIHDYLIAHGAREFEPFPVVVHQPAPAPSQTYYDDPSPAPPQVASAAPSQTSGQRAAQAVVQGLQQVQDTMRGSLDTGRYRRSGQREEISFTGMANRGNLYYTDADGKRSTGSYSISGDRITMNILGRSFIYTITSRTSFSGHGEDWYRVGF